LYEAAGAADAPLYVYGINQFMTIKVAADHGKFGRLRYVTENFQLLQGLTWVAFGGAFFLFSAEKVPGVPLPWLLGLSGVGLLFASYWYFPKYYERRFGSVESKTPSNAQFLTLMLVLLFMIFFGRAVGRYANSAASEISNETHRMIRDPDHRANLLPVLFWFVLLFLGASSKSPALSRLRVAFDCGCLFCWTGVLTILPIRYPEVTQQTLWRIVNAGWLGITIMLVGLYDHVMLVRLLPKRHRTKDDE